ncbi:MAG: hypothetical protein AB7C97_04955 [Oscillospiraceae bacterium]
MGIDFKKGYFDAVADAHGILGLTSTLTPEDKTVALRAYINFRLLFWREMYFTDASINNNPTLRYLMFEDRTANSSKYPLLPRDYNKLLSGGVFKIAVRDSLPIGSHARELYNLQRENKYTDIPSQAYSEAIDGIVLDSLGSETNIVTPFPVKEVSLLFSKKVKEYLRHEAQAYPVLNKAKTMLYNYFSETEVINYNELLTRLASKGYAPNSEIYNRVKSDVSTYYNTSVPEILRLNYETSVKSLVPGEVLGEYIPTADQKTKENHISFNYAFNAEVLAYMPSDVMLAALSLSQRYKFIKILNDTVTGQNIDIDVLSAAYESYVKQLDSLFKNTYGGISSQLLKLIKNEKNKNLIIRIYENKYSKGIQLLLGFVPYFGCFSSTLFYLLDQFIIPKIDLTKIDAQQKLQNAQFYQQLSEKSIIVRKDE